MMKDLGRSSLWQRLKKKSPLGVFVALSVLGFACNSGSGGVSDLSLSSGYQGQSSAAQASSSAPISSNPVPSISPSASPLPSPSLPPTAQVGESCTGDPSRTCLAIHFVSYTNSLGVPTATTTQAATIVRTMNQLFAPCAIGFQIEKYEAVDPTQYNLDYGANSQNQLNRIRQTFDLPSNQLLAVTTGPWGTSVNAWTNMPGEGVYGAIMESSIVNYGNGIIYAHEFGHYLGLDHASSSSNLMNPIIYTTSTQLSASQCQIAQRSLHAYWADMIRK